MFPGRLHRVGFLPDSQQWMVVLDDMEWRSTDINVEVFTSPYYIKGFHLN